MASVKPTVPGNIQAILSLPPTNRSLMIVAGSPTPFLLFSLPKDLPICSLCLMEAGLGGGLDFHRCKAQGHLGPEGSRRASWEVSWRKGFDHLSWVSRV